MKRSFRVGKWRLWACPKNIIIPRWRLRFQGAWRSAPLWTRRQYIQRKG